MAAPSGIRIRTAMFGRGSGVALAVLGSALLQSTFGTAAASILSRQDANGNVHVMESSRRLNELTFTGNTAYPYDVCEVSCSF